MGHAVDMVYLGMFVQLTAQDGRASWQNFQINHSAPFAVCEPDMCCVTLQESHGTMRVPWEV